MQLQFKYPSLGEEWPRLDVRLRDIIIPVFQMLCAQRNHPVVVVTSVHREDGVHSAWRACDIRNPWMHDMAVAEELGAWINDRFVYGRTGAGTPTHVCIVGRFDPRGKHLDHFHFQVPAAPLKLKGDDDG